MLLQHDFFFFMLVVIRPRLGRFLWTGVWFSGVPFTGPLAHKLTIS